MSISSLEASFEFDTCSIGQNYYHTLWLIIDVERQNEAAGPSASPIVGANAAVSAPHSQTVPNITSLEDITSMEDITSLEELQLDEVKNEGGLTSPDRVEKFRQTVKAMSTQVTPQTSPLGNVTKDLTLLGLSASGLCIFKRIGHVNIRFSFLFIGNTQLFFYSTRSILIGCSTLSQEYCNFEC